MKDVKVHGMTYIEHNSVQVIEEDYKANVIAKICESNGHYALIKTAYSIDECPFIAFASTKDMLANYAKAHNIAIIKET